MKHCHSARGSATTIGFSCAIRQIYWRRALRFNMAKSDYQGGMTLKSISKTIIVSQRRAVTRPGFSFGLASCSALRSFLIKLMDSYTGAVEPSTGTTTRLRKV